ncbi:hypothetical protein [Streptomyces albogriseolus]|nr:hypothetical protein [Streptomyces albogriseolus]
MAEPNFQDRMFLESEAVYAAVQRGEVADVSAALMDAQVRASHNADQD